MKSSPVPDDEVPLVSIQVDSPTTVITVQGFGDAEQGKKNKLLNSLEGVEGVETVEVTGPNRILVRGTAPSMELGEVAKAVGFDAEVRVDLTAADPIPDAKPQQSEEDKKLFMIKASAICCLIVQNCAQALTMKYANGDVVVDTEGHKYLATTVVVMAELFKIIASCFVIMHTTGGIVGLKSEITNEMIKKPIECAKLLVPSLLYTLQNNLQFIALKNLSAAVFQVTAQLKIMTTALFTVLLLGRTLGPHKWASLVVLMCGCMFVNLDSLKPTPAGAVKQEGNQLYGVICCLIGACTSGLAGVYFEKMLKGAKTSLWIRQIQLGLGGLVIGTIGAYSQDGAIIAKNGFFQGYTNFIWMVVCINSLGGLLVAVVVKYTDNIAKAFAVSVSIILSSFISVPLFGIPITLLFMIGTVLVVGSIFLYEAIVPFDTKVNIGLALAFGLACYLAPWDKL